MEGIRQEKICKCCNSNFITYYNYMFCSPECEAKYNKHGKRKDKYIYTRVCSMCGKPFKTPYINKNLCSFECKQEHVRERSRMYARRKRNNLKKYAPCIICGFDLATDIHKERGKTYVLCPNHHALITRNIKTLNELLKDKTI